MIEMIVVISLIVALTTILFANYNTIDKKGEVLRYSDRLKNELQLAQNYSVNYKMHDSHAYGWGVKADRLSNSFTIFADKDGDKLYSYPVKLLIHGTEDQISGSYYESSHTNHEFISYSGATRISSSGKPAGDNGYWQFEGSEDCLIIDDTDGVGDLDFDFTNGADTTDFVIDLWFYPDADNTGRRTLISKWDDSNSSMTSFFCEQTATYHVRCAVDTTSGTFYVDTSTNPANGPIIANRWYHLALVRNDQELKLYLHGDGVPISQIVLTELPPGANIASNSSDLIIGGRYSGFNYVDTWSGRIDEIRIAKGIYQWELDFDLPTDNHVADVEELRTTILAPEIYFSNLQISGTDTNELNIYFSRDDFSMHLNDTTLKDAVMIIKHRIDNNIFRAIEVTSAGVVDLL